MFVLFFQSTFYLLFLFAFGIFIVLCFYFNCITIWFQGALASIYAYLWIQLNPEGVVYIFLYRVY